MYTNENNWVVQPPLLPALLFVGFVKCLVYTNWFDRGTRKNALLYFIITECSGAVAYHPHLGSILGIMLVCS